MMYKPRYSNLAGNLGRKWAIERHAQNRAAERYGIDSPRKIAEVKRLAKQVPSIDGNRGREVTWEGKLVKVIYDDKHDSIVTFLPPEYVWAIPRNKEAKS